MVLDFEKVADSKRMNFILNVLQNAIPPGGKVLDVGCGNGIISQSLGRNGYHVLGIDISEQAIATARASNTLNNVVFKVMSAEALALGSRKYDAVICSEVLEHLHHPESLLQSLYKCLDGKGVLIVTVPNGMGPRELLVTRPVQYINKKDNWLSKGVRGLKKLMGYSGTTVQSAAEDLMHVQFFTKQRLEHLAVSTNFQVVQFGKTNFIEDVFPYSFFTKRLRFLQKIDCLLADRLPHQLNGGFVTVWKKVVA